MEALNGTNPESQSTSFNAKGLIVGIVLALIFLLIGLGTGYILFKSQEIQTPLDNFMNFNKVNYFSMITAGTITEVQQNIITIEREDEQIQLSLNAESLEIKRIVYPSPQEVDEGKKLGSTEILNINDLRIGDTIIASSKILPDKTLSVVSITVLGSQNALPPIPN